MNKKYPKVIVFISSVLVVLLAVDTTYAWTTKVGSTEFFVRIPANLGVGTLNFNSFANVEGHETLTKDAAYCAGDYYKDWFDEHGVGFIKTGIGLLTYNNDYNYTRVNVIESGWGSFKKKFKKACKSITNTVKSTVAGAVSGATCGLIATMALNFVVLPVLTGGTSLLIGPALIGSWAVAGGAMGFLASRGLFDKLIPYYGTYSTRTKSLIAGARYQDLEDNALYDPDFYKAAEDNDNQKYHFLRRNFKDAGPYNVDRMRDEIDNDVYGIKQKGIYEPLAKAFMLEDTPDRIYYIGDYEETNVTQVHFAMGMVLHTVQDSFAHCTREPKLDWAITGIRVYAPRGDSSLEHENIVTTVNNPGCSIDRIYGEWWSNITTIGCSKKAAAQKSQDVCTAMLRLWKDRQTLFANYTGSRDNTWDIAEFLKTTAWKNPIDYTCRHI